MSVATATAKRLRADNIPRNIRIGDTTIATTSLRRKGSR
jgi:hypothetical protein